MSYIRPWNCIFNPANNKTFFWPTWSIYFRKSVFVFWYSYMITNFKFRIFFVRTNISLDVTSIGFISIVLWKMSLYLLTKSSKTSKQTFLIQLSCAYELFFKVLLTDFPSPYLEYISMSFFLKNLLKRLL